MIQGRLRHEDILGLDTDPWPFFTRMGPIEGRPSAIIIYRYLDVQLTAIQSEK
jgi:hypothetical protein